MDYEYSKYVFAGSSQWNLFPYARIFFWIMKVKEKDVNTILKTVEEVSTSLHHLSLPFILYILMHLCNKYIMDKYYVFMY